MYAGLCLHILVHILLKITAAENLPPYTPTDLILLDCGARSNSISQDGRKWNTDTLSKFDVSNSRNSSSAFTASENDRSVPAVPYMTARIFHSTFTYTFPLSPGPKFVRLYFYPAAYSNLDISKSFFSLKANHYTLLSNFSAFLTASAIQPRVFFLKKEFVITVQENQMLNMTFDPSPKSFAFINGIEIVSMPNGLYEREVDAPVTFVGSDTLISLDETTALETLYRLNVGGAYVGGINDTGMFRTWLDDSDFIFSYGIVNAPNKSLIKYTRNTPPFVAPTLVYTTMRSLGADHNLNVNLTWILPVDPGFNYLVRLHFCEVRKVVTKAKDVVFSILINNQTAEEATDIIYLSGGNSVPVYKDYIVSIPKHSHGKQGMWLTLHPKMDRKPHFVDAFLNGLEVLKLNNSDGSLAYFNLDLIVPLPEHHPRLGERKKSKASLLIVAIVGPVFAGIVAIFLVACIFVLKQRRVDVSGKSTVAKSFRVAISCPSRSIATNASLRPSNHFRRFSLFEIEVATTQFDDEFIIGSGGFGNVYKGLIDDGATLVAIKRLNLSSRQGAREFKTEIQLLSKLRHQHLVALIGYCDDPGEMILVYEYMSRGTLRDHLYKTKNPSLPWKQRLEICIGAARGLHYLHTGATHPIIHRDVKSTNILVDESWVAKVSDFGLSRIGPTSQSQTHVSTVVRGSIGYVDPEYYRRQQLTEKSDVYSFGVVLFEVLCSRPAVIPGLPREQVSLSDWARICYERRALGNIMDPNLRGDIDFSCLEKFGEIAYSCLHDQGTQRPTMSDVVLGLELALQLQETAKKNRIIVDKGREEQESPLLMHREAVTSDDDDLFSGSGGTKEESTSTVIDGIRGVAQSDPHRFRSESVFSELVNEKGR